MKDNREKQKRLAIQLMEREIIKSIASRYDIDFLQAMSRLYDTTTYSRYTARSDFFGLAREGTYALIHRVLYELDHGKPMVTSYK